MSSFTPATRLDSYARIALCGPSGSGKTYTGLALAHGLGEKIALIDTERRSASKYTGVNSWAFDQVAPDSFSPDSLTALLAEAADEDYDIVVIDSLSHYWMGVDGMLEQADKLKHGTNSFSGWKEARPAERRMIDAFMAFPGHIIVTLRVKTEYVIEDDSRGKKVPKKVGMKPEQREGIDYEFDIVGDLDLDHTMVISKTRLPILDSAVIPHPGLDLAKQISEWLSEGERLPNASELRDKAFAATDRDGLAELGKYVESIGLGNAAVRDETGEVLTLIQVIRNRYMSIAPPPAPTKETDNA